MFRFVFNFILFFTVIKYHVYAQQFLSPTDPITNEHEIANVNDNEDVIVEAIKNEVSQFILHILQKYCKRGLPLNILQSIWSNNIKTLPSNTNKNKIPPELYNQILVTPDQHNVSASYSGNSKYKIGNEIYPSNTELSDLNKPKKTSDEDLELRNNELNNNGEPLSIEVSTLYSPGIERKTLIPYSGELTETEVPTKIKYQFNKLNEGSTQHPFKLSYQFNGPATYHQKNPQNIELKIGSPSIQFESTSPSISNHQIDDSKIQQILTNFGFPSSQIDYKNQYEPDINYNIQNLGTTETSGRKFETSSQPNIKFQFESPGYTQFLENIGITRKLPTPKISTTTGKYEISTEFDQFDLPRNQQQIEPDKFEFSFKKSDTPIRIATKISETEPDIEKLNKLIYNVNQEDDGPNSKEIEDQIKQIGKQFLHKFQLPNTEHSEENFEELSKQIWELFTTTPKIKTQSDNYFETETNDQTLNDNLKLDHRKTINTEETSTEENSKPEINFKLPQPDNEFSWNFGTEKEPDNNFKLDIQQPNQINTQLNQNTSPEMNFERNPEEINTEPEINDEMSKTRKGGHKSPWHFLLETPPKHTKLRQYFNPEINFEDLIGKPEQEHSWNFGSEKRPTEQPDQINKHLSYNFAPEINFNTNPEQINVEPEINDEINKNRKDGHKGPWHFLLETPPKHKHTKLSQYFDPEINFEDLISKPEHSWNFGSERGPTQEPDQINKHLSYNFAPQINFDKNPEPEINDEINEDRKGGHKDPWHFLLEKPLKHKHTKLSFEDLISKLDHEFSWNFNPEKEYDTELGSNHKPKDTFSWLFGTEREPDTNFKLNIQHPDQKFQVTTKPDHKYPWHSEREPDTDFKFGIQHPEQIKLKQSPMGSVTKPDHEFSWLFDSKTEPVPDFKFNMQHPEQTNLKLSTMTPISKPDHEFPWLFDSKTKPAPDFKFDIQHPEHKTPQLSQFTPEIKINNGPIDKLDNEFSWSFAPESKPDFKFNIQHPGQNTKHPEINLGRSSFNKPDHEFSWNFTPEKESDFKFNIQHPGSIDKPKHDFSWNLSPKKEPNFSQNIIPEINFQAVPIRKSEDLFSWNFATEKTPVELIPNSKEENKSPDTKEEEIFKKSMDMEIPKLESDIRKFADELLQYYKTQLSELMSIKLILVDLEKKGQFPVYSQFDELVSKMQAVLKVWENSNEFYDPQKIKNVINIISLASTHAAELLKTIKFPQESENGITTESDTNIGQRRNNDISFEEVEELFNEIDDFKNKHAIPLVTLISIEILPEKNIDNINDIAILIEYFKVILKNYPKLQKEYIHWIDKENDDQLEINFEELEEKVKHIQDKMRPQIDELLEKYSINDSSKIPRHVFKKLLKLLKRIYLLKHENKYIFLGLLNLPFTNKMKQITQSWIKHLAEKLNQDPEELQQNITIVALNQNTKELQEFLNLLKLNSKHIFDVESDNNWIYNIGSNIKRPQINDNTEEIDEIIDFKEDELNTDLSEILKSRRINLEDSEEGTTEIY